ncbi:glucose 1-dehydrogenase [Heliobacterium chlorum]|uniref:Glucose 1-dehydrogenase n=1 Tax=Heliobacterium chlorum TaxID=2698 RepID=A0ABR7T630_HELCL|nr:glucose 1-dehydrogenase [Heliobacterium chlorum]MBC9785820.1 glucose 1-dehydrogenase [Heliobacterium chlorum]
MEYKGKVALITGAGRGIGRGIAQMYASQGATVIIAEQNTEDGRKAETELRLSGGRAYFYPLDVRQPQAISSFMVDVEKQCGRIDILVNNAGVSRWKSPYELTVEEWDDILNTNLRSVFLCSREAAKVMRRHGGGAIVNIASTRSIMSEPDSEAYAASKGGIVALTHALALSFSADKIRVNAISPGWIETGDYDQLRPIDHDQHPAGRVGTPEDVARACLFLTAEGNDFITGTNLILDGGMTRKMIYQP